MHCFWQKETIACYSTSWHNLYIYSMIHQWPNEITKHITHRWIVNNIKLIDRDDKWQSSTMHEYIPKQVLRLSLGLYGISAACIECKGWDFLLDKRWVFYFVNRTWITLNKQSLNKVNHVLGFASYFDPNKLLWICIRT